ncbi:MAG: ABC transporter ATP-binding protein [Limnohabitans sp.]|nr:ABC transporter ATP-binding protein [Limnohabitans sp.]
MAFLELQQVGYTYPGWPPVMQGVDWSLPEGEFHCLVGRSGCGKTTWLKLAAGLLRPDHGTLRLQGQAVQGPTPSMGFVFQSPTLLDWLSVLDNVLLPIRLHRAVQPKDVEQAQSLLAQMGLSTWLHQSPARLSGGQQSRVAIARALVTQPALLLMDEPFAALDAMTREDLQWELAQLCRARKTSVLFVTHDMTEAVYLADRVAVMSEGRVVGNVAIDLPRPRRQAVRYSPDFNDLCAQLRARMEDRC